MKSEKDKCLYCYRSIKVNHIGNLRKFCSEKCCQHYHRDERRKDLKCIKCDVSIAKRLGSSKYCEVCGPKRLNYQGINNCLGCGKQTSHIYYCHGCKVNNIINPYFKEVREFLNGLTNIGVIESYKICNYYVLMSGKDTMWNGLPVSKQVKNMLNWLIDLNEKSTSI